MHTEPIPRTGGLAIFISFALSMFFLACLSSWKCEVLVRNERLAFFCLGMLICFGVGLYDDFRRLTHKSKFFFQIIAATIAFYGGVRVYTLLGMNLTGPVSYLATVFWFVLFVNAVNLIDGLDGLAAGICLFVCLMMIIFGPAGGVFPTVLFFAAISGSLLGFLFYNFNPATIFMGDSGSYFLGYMIAGLSILSSTKSEVGVFILMPLVALGVPVFDTLLSPLRRWILGQAVFRADNKHIHHQLIRMGFSTKRAVIWLYGITLALCAFSILIVHIYNYRVGFFLITMALGFLLLTRRLGYFEYVTYDKIYGWFRDIKDVTGIHHDRRSFLSLQVELSKSTSFDELWANVGEMLDRLKFMKGEFRLSSAITAIYENQNGKLLGEKYGKGNGNGNGNHSWQTSTIRSNGSVRYVWTCADIKNKDHTSGQDLMKIELPLFNRGDIPHGILVLIKDLKSEPLTPYTLRRLEHLRRTIAETLEKIEKDIRHPEPQEISTNHPYKTISNPGRSEFR